jgi:hypothetical protein
MLPRPLRRAADPKKAIASGFSKMDMLSGLCPGRAGALIKAGAAGGVATVGGLVLR